MGLRPATETRILDAAEDLFFTRGIAATPIDAVIERAGVSAATLYRGYPSKELLLAAALDRRQGAWRETWDAAVARKGDAEGRLLAVFDALEDFRGEPRGSRWCAFLGAAAEYADPPPEVASAVRADTEGMRGRLIDLARPVAGERASELAERLLLVVSGDLAMRLREPAHRVDVARSTAAILVAATSR
ncbi:TetR/AcrR family transcriptional regulator [Microbacterium oleivorans]|uniref:TetR/AcrR family transcriptional regulator n=1 Tax=Microbacterium oleivorans TaxID=273677 RepID=A0A7D5JXM8_9MICO|nr:TetR/AcrR family transcriptional regulator [Microbacterium oleivorans]QLD11143.1 TetR/AcrR family transcriptional regulator [Microbacterium oleivorans]